MMMLSARADVYAVDDSGLTALYLACANGHVDTVCKLLAANSYINQSHESGSKCLHVAIKERHHAAVGRGC